MCERRRRAVRERSRRAMRPQTRLSHCRTLSGELAGRNRPGGRGGGLWSAHLILRSILRSILRAVLASILLGAHLSLLLLSEPTAGERAGDAGRERLRNRRDRGGRAGRAYGDGAQRRVLG